MRRPGLAHGRRSATVCMAVSCVFAVLSTSTGTVAAASPVTIARSGAVARSGAAVSSAPERAQLSTQGPCLSASATPVVRPARR